MHTSSILLLAIGLMASVAMARPGKRPGHGHHNHHRENGNGEHGNQWLSIRLPDHINIPQAYAEKLGQPRPTFTAKKIFNGKYLLISPALIFKIKQNDHTTQATSTTTAASTTEEIIETSTTPAIEETTTTEEIDVETTTTDEIDVETTTTEEIEIETTTDEEIDESTTTEPEEEEESTTTSEPSFFRKRSFAINKNKRGLFRKN